MTVDEFIEERGIEVETVREAALRRGDPTFFERLQDVMPDNIVHLMMFGFTVWVFCVLVNWLSGTRRNK